MGTFYDKIDISVLTDWPGVTTGTLANNTARQVNRNNINNCIADAATNKKLLIIPPATYEIHGGAVIFATSYQRVIGDPSSIFLQYQLDSPCVHVGPPINTAGTTIEGVSIDGLFLKFAGTGTATTVSGALSGGFGLELTGAFDCSFKNIQIGDPNQGASSATSVPYCGVFCDPRSGTIPCFSNKFENIRAKNFVFAGWHQYRNAFDAATGNSYTNLYISAGGAGDVRDISAVGGIPMYFGSLANSSFDQINIEWSTAKTALHMEVCRANSWNSLNIEGITLKNTGGTQDSGVVSLYQSQAVFNGIMIQNITFNSANSLQNPSMFRLQDFSVASIDNFYPTNNSKTGISNLALARNWDSAGNQGMYANLGSIHLGDNDQIDLIDGLTYSTGNDGIRFGELNDFNNYQQKTWSNADQTMYAYRTPAYNNVPAATSTKNVTLARTCGSTGTLAQRIPAGVIRWIKASSSSTVQVKNYEGTNLGAAIAAGSASAFLFDGTNWVRLVVLT